MYENVENKGDATSCRICKRKHHSLLHPKDVSTSTANPKSVVQAAETGSGEATHIVTENTQNESTPTVNCFATGIVKDEVLLATALVKAESKTGDYQVIRAFIDPGSQSSFVTEAVVQALGLKKVPTKSSITGLGGEPTSAVPKYTVDLTIQSLVDPAFKIVVKPYVLNKVTNYLPGKQATVPEWLKQKQLTLADPTYNRPNKIDVLFGGEVYCQILTDGVLKGPKGFPLLQCTTLGWIISGPDGSTSTNDSVTVLHTQVNEDDMLKRFWEMEAEPKVHSRLFTTEEQRCEDFFASTTVRDQQGRYVVKLPFRDDPTCKGNSRKIAVKRLHSLERKFEKDSTLKARYTEVIKEYEQLGHMKPVTEQDHKKEEAIYLPHHAVIREDKSTTKVRVVLDASSKYEDGISLNDQLMTGPTLQPELRHLILRWRQYPVCLVADIVKMYRMVRVANEDTDFQRIVWRDNAENEIKDYKLLTVTFGTASAPYLAVKARNQVACDHREQYPIAAPRVHQEFYMDDLMTGCQTEDEGLQLYHEMKGLLNEGGFVLQKWASNKKELSKQINRREGENLENKEEKSNLEIKTDNITKILGLTWNRDDDEFQYSVKLPPLSPPATKRKIISDVSRLFDPLGWLAPCVIAAKMFIQRLWLAGIGWDEEPPSDILQDWLTYREQLAHLIDFRIPRWLHTHADDTLHELHGFCDASNAAYAAVVYLRVVDSTGNIHVALVTAKTRVSPVKQVSIPRLELCGAVLVAKLLAEVAEVMKIPKPNIRAWTDSTVVLAWLNKHPSSWKTFVANRVAEILNTMDSAQWSHIRTKENPADCASRGMQPAELKEHDLWKFGPKLLHDKVIQYAKPKNNDTNLEQAARVHVGIVEEEFWNKYSSLNRLIRVVAYCRRFLRKRDSTQNNQVNTRYLQKWEMDEAALICVKKCQNAEFKNEIEEINKSGYISSKTSKIRSLTPFLENGILRVGGRLQNASELEIAKHPIILPYDSHLTKLIVADAHERTLHGDQRAMLNYLKSAYWIVRAKDLVKQHIHKCVRCIRQKAKIQTQLMGALPSARVTPGRAFIRSGVDYAGPINLRTSKGRGHHSYKGYVCLFICMVTKAIHLEVVSELTSRGFLEAFKRFTSRRGRCLEIYSDNGTNFVGAAKELKDLFNAEKSAMVQEIAESLALNGTTWHFIPPKSPNFGGLWEAGIKSTKYHIKRVIGESTLTYEEMATLLSQIERYKWAHQVPEPNVGDVVLVKEDDLPPSKWLFGRIMQKHPGSDQLTRVGIYMKEDYSKEVLEKRKQLQSQVEEEKKKGNIAFLVHDKLVVKKPKENTREKRKREESKSPNSSALKIKTGQVRVGLAHEAALNVLSLKSEENLTELEHALQQIKWDIVGLSEVISIGENIAAYPDYLLYHKGEIPGQ
ncbi:uncharacterized protein LOC134791133 [Cydia splendana]|uniref:uncharacterized protein LOC134791133 n=1 Tax=Cydia splendana TaxID=1100963 RepID=UPI00300C0B7C